MKILKNLALSFLSFLLFLSLSLFGLALMLNSTLLNPDFVTSEINRLDVSSLVSETLSGQAPEAELPEELRTSLLNTIDQVEPLLKEQVSAATDSIYAYLLGKDESLNLALVLRNTVLSSNFVVSVVNELDISPLMKATLRAQLATQEMPVEMESLLPYLDSVIVKLEPWVKEQVAIAADPLLDYLVGESPSLKVVVSLEPVKQVLSDTLREFFFTSPPPELAIVPQAMRQQYFEQFSGELTKMLPSSYELNERLLARPAGITEALAEAENSLAQAKQYVGYFQLYYKVLIGFILLLILGIILINRGVKSTTRSLGTIFLTYGAFEYAGILVAKYFIPIELPLAEMPLPLQTWLPQFFDNLLAPLEILSLGFLIGGIALIIVSFLYQPRQP